MMLPAPLLSLEPDIMASLAGKDFPSIWSCGRDWSRARTPLLDPADILPTRSRDNGRRLVHRTLVYERTTQTHIFQFSEKAFNGLQAIWQRLVIAALATLLLDPERCDHSFDVGSDSRRLGGSQGAGQTALRRSRSMCDLSRNAYRRRPARNPVDEPAAAAAERMKGLARERGPRLADFDTQTVETSIRDDLAGYRNIFAVRNEAVHLTLDVPSEFARTVRQAARDRRLSPNQLIYTAVCHKPCELSKRAA